MESLKVKDLAFAVLLLRFTDRETVERLIKQLKDLVNKYCNRKDYSPQVHNNLKLLDNKNKFL
jgi:hypothetical protein